MNATLVVVLQMICPYCGFNQSTVLESRDTEEGRVTRRRRECQRCHKRFTTYERIGNIDLKVVKKGGRAELFDPQKIIRGIEKACWKRPVEERTIQMIADEIEMKLLNRQKTTIPSRDIGRMIMNRLRKIDKIAYLRFASVYLDIESVKDFEDILRSVK